MAQIPNKVNWGLAASGWFKITVDENGNDVYGTITRFVGNRQINFTPAGELVNVYADGTVIFVGKSNNGYTGSIESTFLDDEFLKWALTESVDSKNVQYEIQEPVMNRFGLVWEWLGDQSRTRHIMYNVTANRPDINASTANDGGNKSAQYQTLSLIAIPRKSDGIVKAKTRADIDSTVYDSWFNTVYTPTASSDYAVTVNVKSGTTALENALVVLGDGSQGKTDASGNAVFYKSNGTYDVFVSLEGYTAKTDTVTVSSAAVTKNISLTAA